MSNAALLAECHQLALTVAPELEATQPLYVMAADELAGLPCGGCLGWASSDEYCDANILARLGERYRGAGHLIVLDFKAIEAAAGPGSYEHCVRTVALHEAAHLLPVKTVLEPPDKPWVRDRQLARMEHAWKMPQPEPGQPDDVHDWRFIRRAVHLAYRAAMAGMTFTWDGLFGPQLWLAAPECYLTTLLRECSAMSGATFREIEATEPPAEFMQVWEINLEFYRTKFCMGPSRPYREGN